MAPMWAKRTLSYEGKVVLGHIARSFFPAYLPGQRTHYGSVVYSTNDIPTMQLFAMAFEVNELRKDKTPPPPGTERIARAMRDDRSRFARLALPLCVSRLESCYLANLCIHRTRLPLGYLHDRLVPLLIAPHKTQWCCLLPLRFWALSFTTLWKSGLPALAPEPLKAQCAMFGVRP